MVLLWEELFGGGTNAVIKQPHAVSLSSHCHSHSTGGSTGTASASVEVEMEQKIPQALSESVSILATQSERHQDGSRSANCWLVSFTTTDAWIRITQTWAVYLKICASTLGWTIEGRCECICLMVCVRSLKRCTECPFLCPTCLIDHFDYVPLLCLAIGQ